jgi:hypothetical protein
VTEEKEAKLPKQQTQDHGPRCPTCAAFPRLTNSMLDVRRDKMVRLFTCSCGERIWDD